MDKMKQWVALTALGAVAIMAGGWFLVVSPKRSHASELKVQAASQQRSNMDLQTQLAALKAQAKDLPAQQAKLAAVAAKIPSNSGMPTLLRALDAAAADTGVELVSVAPGAATAVTAAGVAPRTAATTTSGTAAAPRTAASLGTLESIPLALNVVGSYFQVAEYLDRLENLPRALRVSGFTLAPGSNPVKDPASQPSADSGKLLNATINGMVFQTTSAPTALVAGK